ncbi:hypothetical protein T439DRAFT_330118 [Meredithblackwellia eburnea MCA 4105]
MSSSTPNPGNKGFSTYASRLLSSLSPNNDEPLFYSTYTTRDGLLPTHEDDDILGKSDDGEVFTMGKSAVNRGLEGDDDDDDQDEDNHDDEQDGERKPTGASSFWDRAVAPPTLPVFSMGMSRIPPPFSSLSPSTSTSAAGKQAGGISGKGWRSHQSQLVSEVYREEDDDEDGDDGRSDGDTSFDGEEEPPEFLSPLSTVLPNNQAQRSESTTAPLLPVHSPSSHTSSGDQHGGAGSKFLTPLPPRAHSQSRILYHDSTWIVLYGFALLFVIFVGVREWWENGFSFDALPNHTTLLPLLPTITTLSLTSLLAGLTSLSFLLFLQNGVANFIAVVLVGAPVVLVAAGVLGWAGSFSLVDEGEGSWKWLIRGTSSVALVTAYWSLRRGVSKRGLVKRTVKVLELSSRILLSHPTLLLLTLSLSLLSLLLTLPFLLLLSLSLSHSPLITLSILIVWFWTLGAIRGVQRVTTAGTAGMWFFERHEAWYDGLGEKERVRGALARATHPLLGTILLSSFLLTLLQTLLYLLIRLRAFLRSASLPMILNPLTCFIPILGIGIGVLEGWEGYVMCFAGMTERGWGESRRGLNGLRRRGGSGGNGARWRDERNDIGGIGDNVLTHLLLSLFSLLWGLLSGLVSFYIIAPRFATSPSQSWGGKEQAEAWAVVATLCFVVPIWTVRFCQGVLGDTADTLYIALLMDRESGKVHCAKAAEAFAEPESDPTSANDVV